MLSEWSGGERQHVAQPIHARDESEHGEANYAGRGGGGNRGYDGGNQHQNQHQNHQNQQPSRPNSEGKLPELQPRNVTAVGGPDNMQTSAAFALRYSAACARYKATF